jgi:hypothetical protein
MKRFATVTFFIFGLWTLDPASGAERCGATERWAVKFGTDPDASMVERDRIRDITVPELNRLPQLRDDVPIGDNTTRLEEERVAYRVSGRLVRFKFEDDDDYHLVITDDSLRYTPGGSGTAGEETGTSFIAEIPDPKCYAGKHGDPQRRSEFEEQLRDARIKFERRFPGGDGHDTNLGGIPVTIVGVAFYDRLHNQTGRAVNGIELHPILDIVFDDERIAVAAAGAPGGPSTAIALFRAPATWSTNNPALRERRQSEEDDDDGADVNAIRLGGHGRARTDSIWQTARIGNAGSKVALRFALKIKTDDKSTSPSSDTLVVQVRTTSGKLQKTLATFSHASATKRPRSVDLDVSRFRNKIIRLQFTSRENSRKNTRFIISNARIEHR